MDGFEDPRFRVATARLAAKHPSARRTPRAVAIDRRAGTGPTETRCIAVPRIYRLRPVDDRAFQSPRRRGVVSERSRFPGPLRFARSRGRGETRLRRKPEKRRRRTVFSQTVYFPKWERAAFRNRRSRVCGSTKTSLFADSRRRRVYSAIVVYEHGFVVRQTK